MPINVHPLKSLVNLRNPAFIVLLLTFIIFSALGAAIWDINFWPSDTEVYYFGPTVELPNLKYISQIHESVDQERVKWLHGKEMFILSASVFQRLLHDTETLRPFILVCLLSAAFSALLIYLLTSYLFGFRIGLVCYFIFVTSIWPYLYVLFAKHQPVGLVFFLLSVYFLLFTGKKLKFYLFYILSGMCVCLSLYSSSISVLYLPYYAAAFFYKHYQEAKKQKKKFLFLAQVSQDAVFIGLGFALPFIYFNYPHILKNIKAYFDYVSISVTYNHFFYNQRVLEQWMPAHELNIRGGWLWILKYFLLIMPVVFPLFGAANLYATFRLIFNKKVSFESCLTTLGLLCLCWSSPVLAEIRQVAQYGANYFSSFIGIILFIGYALYLAGRDKWIQTFYSKFKLPLIAGVVLLAMAHVGINAYVFSQDVYPTRMAMTFISRKIEALGIDKIYTYKKNPQKVFVTETLNKKLLKKLNFIAMDNINEPASGYILIPPITGNSIYIAATSSYTDFDSDIFLNELVIKGTLKDYAVASYRTLASSRIWPHEEEILSYRYLILDHFRDDTEEKGKVWLLDAQKIRRDVFKNFPNEEYVYLTKNKIQNIGSHTLFYIYKGYYASMVEPITLNYLAVKMYKTGNPQDQLVAYAYRQDDKQSTWVPYSADFRSVPISGATLTSDKKGDVVLFKFPKALYLKPGPYYFVIYRTGPGSDQDFYRIYKDLLAIK